VWKSGDMIAFPALTVEIGQNIHIDHSFGGKMKTKLSLFVSAIIFLGAQFLFAERLEETVKKSVEVQENDNVTVKGVNGNISVDSWDKDIVEVVAVKKVKASCNDDAHEAMENLKIIVKENGNGIKVYADVPDRSKNKSGLFSWLFAESNINYAIHYSLMVPKKFNVTLKSTNGNIKIVDTNGSIALKTTNGNIKAENVAGVVQASTTNGSIKVNIDKIEANEEMRFATTNGSINLYLPSDVNLDLSASTTNGSVSCDLPFKSEGSFSRKKMVGKINDGGAELVCKTTNGTIKIKEK
jgi:DUF4097 and DUF4098 domain-containing protein YvlB